MCGIQDAISNLMPVDWLDPYGRTPFAGGADLTVDITIVETDDGIKAKSVKTPPTTGSTRLMQAMKQALGITMIDSMSPCSSSQSDDQGKQNNMINNDKKDESQESQNKSQDSEIHDTMKSSSSGNSGHRDRNPGSQRSPEPSRYGATEDEDEEKTPRFK